MEGAVGAGEGAATVGRGVGGPPVVVGIGVALEAPQAAATSRGIRARSTKRNLGMSAPKRGMRAQ